MAKPQRGWRRWRIVVGLLCSCAPRAVAPKAATFNELAVANVTIESSEPKHVHIEQLMNHSHKQGLFNGTVLVAEHGTVLYADAFGLANRATNEALENDSVFCLASVSKQLTAMAVLILEKQKKLSLDDRLSDFFPYFPKYARQVSIEHLLTHTSGVADHFRLGLHKPGLTHEDVLKALSQQESLDFEPGERFAYSNGGYVLLSLIIEKASGKSFHAFLKDNIFDPLGMNHTLVYDQLKPVIDKRAVSYDAGGGPANYDILTTGAGGIFSTVEDLFKWDRALYTDQLVSREQLICRPRHSESLEKNSGGRVFSIATARD